VAKEAIKESIRWTLEKRDADINEYIERYGKEEGEHRFYAEVEPYERRVIEGNILVTAGIQLLEDLLIAAGGTAFNNANARIGVGDSSTAAAVGQTDLQAAANKLRKGMEATFPSRSGTTVSFKSSFGTSEANFAWNEWAIFNAASGGTMLNRKVESLGTKASGTWTLQADLAIS
jgi:hypothetical protein